MAQKDYASELLEEKIFPVTVAVMILVTAAIMYGMYTFVTAHRMGAAAYSCKQADLPVETEPVVPLVEKETAINMLDILSSDRESVKQAYKARMLKPVTTLMGNLSAEERQRISAELNSKCRQLAPEK